MNLIKNLRTFLAVALVAASASYAAVAVTGSQPAGAVDTGAQVELLSRPMRLSSGPVTANQTISVSLGSTEQLIGVAPACIRGASVNITWSATGPGYVSAWVGGIGLPGNFNTSVLNSTGPGSLVANNIDVATSQVNVNGLFIGPALFNLRPTAGGTMWIDLMAVYTTC